MTQPQILINQLTFTLPTGTPLFTDLTLAFAKCKIGLVGRNGIGKSTLLKLILGDIAPSSGSIQIDGRLAYVPQHPSSLEMTVAGLLECEEKIHALHRITQGSVNEVDFAILNDDWNIKERIQRQLTTFGLNSIPYDRQLNSLSGGELTRLLLVKVFSSHADFLLLDEPTNHLDYTARQQLYQAIIEWKGGLIVVSHDRTLLNLMDEIVELTTLGAFRYGGNYDAFLEQKSIEKIAKDQQLHDAKKFLQKTKNSIQSSHEKHEQKQSYGRELRRSGSIDKMAANSKKGRSEKTQSKLLIKEERMLKQAEKEWQAAKEQIEIIEEIHVDLLKTCVPNGKVILNIEKMSFAYSEHYSIIKNFNLLLQGPERVALIGNNGSGKTTLVKLILSKLQPQLGNIYLGTNYISYLDQTSSLLNPDCSILENFLLLNREAKENDAYRSLAQFLFRNTATHKLVKDLSGGEKLRALLACVLMSSHPPQLLILDEPTNHLDLQSIGSIESALKNYRGAIIVISHDQQFLKNIEISRYIHAPFMGI